MQINVQICFSDNSFGCNTHQNFFHPFCPIFNSVRLDKVFSRIHATLKAALSVSWSVSWLVRWMVCWSLCRLVHQSLITRRTQLMGIGLLFSITEIWISQWYFWLRWGSGRGPWGDGVVMYHPRRGMGLEKSGGLNRWQIPGDCFPLYLWKRRQSEIWISWWYFWLLCGSEGAPCGGGWVMYHREN